MVMMDKEAELEAILKLREINKTNNIEGNHILADWVLRKFVEELGYTNLAKEYDEINKWYS